MVFLPKAQPVKSVGQRAQAKTSQKKTEVTKTVSKQIITPPGVAAYAWLNKPDTRFKEDGVYTITIMFPKEPNAAEEAEANNKFYEEVEELYQAVKARYKKCYESPLKDGDERDDEALHGMYYIQAKSNYPVMVVDSEKNEISPNIWGGDIVRLAINFKETCFANKASLTPYLNLVQLIDKRSTGSGVEAALSAMGKWEGGYTADASRRPQEAEEEETELPDDEIPF